MQVDGAAAAAEAPLNWGPRGRRGAAAGNRCTSPAAIMVSCAACHIPCSYRCLLYQTCSHRCWACLFKHQLGVSVHAGRYRVTATAQALLALMREALSTAARGGSPALAQSLVGAVADIAELAGALPPALRPKTLQVCCVAHKAHV